MVEYRTPAGPHNPHAAHQHASAQPARNPYDASGGAYGGAAHNTSGGTPGWVWGLIAGGVMLVLGCFGGFAVGFFAGVASAEMENAMNGGFAYGDTGLDIQADYPSTAAFGDTISVVVTLTDETGYGGTVSDIDLHGDLVDRATLLSVDPAPHSTNPLDGFIEQSFDQSIPANGSLTITMQFRLDNAGPLNGSIMVYDGDYEQESVQITVEVK